MIEISAFYANLNGLSINWQQNSLHEQLIET